MEISNGNKYNMLITWSMYLYSFLSVLKNVNKETLWAAMEMNKNSKLTHTYSLTNSMWGSYVYISYYYKTSMQLISVWWSGLEIQLIMTETFW
jgi:hypothetical protein